MNAQSQAANENANRWRDGNPRLALENSQENYQVKRELNQEQIKHRLRYDPSTGDFFWNATGNSRKVKVGSRAGWLDEKGYVRIGINGGRYTAHRLAWIYVYGTNPIGLIDHIDCNRSNNSISNLRVVDCRENAQNRAGANSNNKLGLLGVVDRGNGRFDSQIRHKGKAKFLGNFKSKEEAHSAYLKAKEVIHSYSSLGDA